MRYTKFHIARSSTEVGVTAYCVRIHIVVRTSNLVALKLLHAVTTNLVLLQAIYEHLPTNLFFCFLYVANVKVVLKIRSQSNILHFSQYELRTFTR